MDLVMLTLTLFLVTASTAELDKNLDQLITQAENFETRNQLLSRRKRYLTFPDGSSFQMVFCTQTHGYLQIGDVVWFGNTAALAWELPTDPSLFHLLKEYERRPDALRREDSQHLVYLDEYGKVISMKPYKRKKTIINPAFAKRSIEETNKKKTIPRKNIHKSYKNKSHLLLNDLDVKSIDFHRNGRQDLYEKLETFLEALGWRGKECVLRLLCESANSKRDQQGTFLEEILRATFTFPKDRVKSDLHEYDLAYQKGHCKKLYNGCEDSYGSSFYSE